VYTSTHNVGIATDVLYCRWSRRAICVYTSTHKVGIATDILYCHWSRRALCVYMSTHKVGIATDMVALEEAYSYRGPNDLCISRIPVWAFGVPIHADAQWWHLVYSNGRVPLTPRLCGQIH
jgi:hypothetical protein